MSNRVPGLFIVGTDTGVGKTYVAAMIARQLTAEGRTVGVYKPAASGCRREGDALVSDDAVRLWEAAGRPGELEPVCPQRFEAPLAPHLAAPAEGRRLDPGLLRRGLDYWLRRSEIVIVEGAGGLMSPLGEEEYVADLARDFGFPLVVVAPNVLGTINQTLQTLIAASAYCVFSGSPDFMVATNSRGLTAPGAATCNSDTFRGLLAPGYCDIHHTRVTQRGAGLPVAGVVLNHPRPPSAADASLTSNRRELAARCAAPILGEAAFGADRFDAEVDWYALAR